MNSLLNIRLSGEKIRRSIFSMLSSYFLRKRLNFENLIVLDTFAGSGVFGFESMSRGCRVGAFCDSNRKACQDIQNTIYKLNLKERALVYCCKVHLLRSSPFSFSLIFLDPPYYTGFLDKSIANLFKRRWIAHDAFLIIKLPYDEIVNLSMINILNEKKFGINKILFAQINASKNSLITNYTRCQT